MSDQPKPLRVTTECHKCGGGIGQISACVCGVAPADDLITTKVIPPAPVEKKIGCPHCGSGLLWSEDRGAHCDGCDDFDPKMDFPTPPAERQTPETNQIDQDCYARSWQSSFEKMRCHARRLERERDDAREQRDMLAEVVKSRDADRVYNDRKWNELREQRDMLADKMRIISGDGGEASPVNLYEAQEIAVAAISELIAAVERSKQ